MEYIEPVKAFIEGKNLIEELTEGKEKKLKTLTELFDEYGKANSAYRKVLDDNRHISSLQLTKTSGFKYAKSAVNYAESALLKFYTRLMYDKSGINDVVKILRKEFKLKASRSMTTGVRGWHDKSSGYSITGPNEIELVGGGATRFYKEIVERLEKEFTVTSPGIVYTRISESRAVLTIEKLVNKE
jgi:hypothetical protein